MAIDTTLNTQRTNFNPSAGIHALLDTLYRVKFSKHTPLVVVLLSMIYTVYRTQHYLKITFTLDPFVAWPTAVFLELLVLAASASVFIALRGAYIAELKDEDVDMAEWGARISVLALVVAFVALLGVAWADAWALTEQPAPALLMTLVQATQMLFVFCFIIAANLEERERLRTEWNEAVKAGTIERANSCRFCGRPVTSNNRARHERSCAANPDAA